MLYQATFYHYHNADFPRALAHRIPEPTLLETKMNPGDLNQALDEVLCRALSEDLGIEVTADTPVGDLVHQDVTTRNAVEAGVVGRATLFAKEAGVFHVSLRSFQRRTP